MVCLNVLWPVPKPSGPPTTHLMHGPLFTQFLVGIQLV